MWYNREPENSSGAAALILPPERSGWLPNVARRMIYSSLLDVAYIGAMAWALFLPRYIHRNRIFSASLACSRHYWIDRSQAIVWQRLFLVRYRFLLADFLSLLFRKWKHRLATASLHNNDNQASKPSNPPMIKSSLFAIMLQWMKISRPRRVVCCCCGGRRRKIHGPCL